MRQLSDNRKVVDKWRSAEKRLSDISELIILAESENDPNLANEVQIEVESAAKQLEEMEFELAFSGQYDSRNALLSIHAGAGGTESQDWANMLLRMYLRWAENKGYKTEILDISPGEEAGLKNVVVDISGDNVYGYLKGEHGVHRPRQTYVLCFSQCSARS
jgi:peptide chain release factor 2